MGCVPLPNSADTLPSIFQTVTVGSYKSSVVTHPSRRHALGRHGISTVSVSSIVTDREKFNKFKALSGLIRDKAAVPNNPHSARIRGNLYPLHEPSAARRMLRLSRVAALAIASSRVNNYARAGALLRLIRGRGRGRRAADGGRLLAHRRLRGRVYPAGRRRLCRQQRPGRQWG